MTALTIGSLFAGIGGFDLAGEWCGHRTIWTSEIDPYCVALLAERFPAAKQLGDISTIDWSHVERPDILTGGFPCQDISYAGKGAGLAGKRSGLWYEYARAIREVGPRYVIVENVRALFTRGFDAVLGTLADLGYDAEWSMYGAADVGAPHRRHRVWILSYRNGGGRGEFGERHHPHRADVDRGGSWVDHAHGGRRQQRGEVIGSAEVAGSRHDAMVHPASGGRGTEASEPTRRADGGCEGLGDAERTSCRRGAGGIRGAEAQGDCEGSQDGCGADGPRDAMPAMGDAERQRGRGGHGERQDAGNAYAPGEAIRWRDAVPVRGHDGTVRLIPRQAAEEGPESSLRALVDGFSRMVAGHHTSDEGEVDAEASDHRRIEVMRVLWGGDGAQAIQRQTGGCVCVCAEAVLLTVMCQQAGGGHAWRGQATGGATPQSLLRELRCDHGARCASPGSQPLEQLARELADRVSRLPHEVAPQAAEAWDHYSRSRANLWPVSVSSPGRVARLRGIGNAIVPACALPIFGRIAELEAERAVRVAA